MTQSLVVELELTKVTGYSVMDLPRLVDIVHCIVNICKQVLWVKADSVVDHVLGDGRSKTINYMYMYLHHN